MQNRNTTAVFVFVLTEIKPFFSAFVLVTSSKSFAWFQSSNRKKERERETLGHA